MANALETAHSCEAAKERAATTPTAFGASAGVSAAALAAASAPVTSSITTN
jgi:hypothetical protein